jgi:uncharacterized membrane protein
MDGATVRRVILTGVGAGIVAGVIVGLLGSWLGWSPAIMGGAIGAVTGATVTSLHRRRS